MGLTAKSNKTPQLYTPSQILLCYTKSFSVLKKMFANHDDLRLIT